MFREGVLVMVKKYIRKPPASDRQATFNDIDPTLMPIATRLGSTAYFVPSIDEGEYRSIPELCADLRAMNAARKFMRQKGKETIQEADILDELYYATRALQSEEVEDAWT